MEIVFGSRPASSANRRSWQNWPGKAAPPPHRPWAITTEQNRRMRLLHRLRPTPNRVEIHELTMVARLLLGPERFNRLDPLAQQLPSPLEGRPMIFHLLGVPAAANAEYHPAIGG